MFDYSDRSSDPGAPHNDPDHVPRGSLLALGFKGKVELLYVFVGASEACMLVVPAIAAALDAPFLPLAGTSTSTSYPLSPAKLSLCFPLFAY